MALFFHLSRIIRARTVPRFNAAYLNLTQSYLFAEIRRRIGPFTGAHPAVRVIHLGVGVHVIALKASAYRPFSTEVEIREGETAEVNVAVTRQTTW